MAAKTLHTLLLLLATIPILWPRKPEAARRHPWSDEWHCLCRIPPCILYPIKSTWLVNRTDQNEQPLYKATRQPSAKMGDSGIHASSRYPARNNSLWVHLVFQPTDKPHCHPQHQQKPQGAAPGNEPKRLGLSKPTNEIKTGRPQSHRNGCRLRPSLTPCLSPDGTFIFLPNAARRRKRFMGEPTHRMAGQRPRTWALPSTPRATRFFPR